METEKTENSLTNLQRDMINLRQRLDDYDWDYRLSRFSEKIEGPKNEVSEILDEIKLSDNSNNSDNSIGKEWQSI